MNITPLVNFDPVFDRGKKPPKSLAMVGVEDDRVIFTFDWKDQFKVFRIHGKLCRALREAGYQTISIYATDHDWATPRLYLHSDVRDWGFPRAEGWGNIAPFDPAPSHGMEFARNVNGDPFFASYYSELRNNKTRAAC